MAPPLEQSSGVRRNLLIYGADGKILTSLYDYIRVEQKEFQ